MDFTLSKQQQMVQKMYREFAENEVKPLAKKVDAEEYFPKETVEKMGKLGMMGIYFPTEVGGAGGDVLSYVMAVEELSKVCGTTGVIVSAHTSLCAAPIYENGTPEQKAKYLPKLCSGEWLGAFGLTEPGAEVVCDYLRLDYLTYDGYAGIYNEQSDTETVALIYQREHRPRYNDCSRAEHGQDIDDCDDYCDNKYISALVDAYNFEHAQTYQHFEKGDEHYKRIGLDELAHGGDHYLLCL